MSSAIILEIKLTDATISVSSPASGPKPTILTKKMAMKIGGEGKSNLVFPKHVARFAKDAGLAVPPTLARVAGLAKAISEAIPNIEKPHEISEKVAAVIVERAESFVPRFKKA